MADGSINIDLLLNDQTDKTWSEFKSKAETAGKGGYEKFKESFKGDPLVAKLEAQANKAGINNFKELLSKLPKEKRTELLAKAEKGEVVNYEKLLREIPAKVTSEVELNDNATTGLKAIKQQAERTGDKFRRLKDIMIGTFVANAVMGGVNAITNGLKEMTKAGMEYNKEQDTMKTVWTALTTEAPQDGKELVDYINNLSQHSIYAADNINEMAQSFYHVHSNVEETKKWTDAFVALGSTLHMTGPQISESGEMFAKIVAGGKASAEDMSVMINRFPMFGEALQKATGKSMKELYAMSAAGKLSATQFTEALDYLGEKYKGGTEEAMTSMQGMSMYLHSRLQVLSGEVMKSSFNMSKSATAALQSITSDDSMKKFAESIGSAMGSVLGGISKIITYIDKNKDAIIGIIGNVKTIIGLIASGVWETFKDTINLIGTAFGKVSGNSGKAADPLKTVNNLLEEIANHKSALKALGSVMIALFATKKIYGFIAGIDATVKSMKELLIVQKIAGFMDSYKLAQAAAAGGTSKLTLAQTALGLAMKSIPLVAIIGGIVAVGAAFYELYKHNEKFKGFVDGIVKSVGNAFGKVAKVAGDLFNSFKEDMKPITDSLIVLGMSIGEVFGDSWKALTKAFKPFVTLFKSMFDGVGERINKLAKPFEELGGKVGKVFSSLKDSLKDLIAPFTHAGDKGGPIQVVVEKLDGISQWFIANKKVFTDIAGVIGKVLGAAFVALGAIIRGTFELIVPLVKPTFNILVAIVKGTLGVISGLFKALGSTIALILDVITGNWKHVGKDVKGIVSGLGKIVTSILKAMVSAVGNIFHGLVKVIDKALWGLGAGTKPLESLAKAVVKIFKGIGKDIGKALNSISKAWSNTWKTISKVFDVIGKFITKSINNEINNWKKIITFALNVISKVWSVTWTAISKTFQVIWKVLKSFFEREIRGMENTFKFILNAIKVVWEFTWKFVSKTFESIWNGIKKFFKPIIEWLSDIISDTMKFISKAWNKVWQSISDFFGDIWKAIKKTGSNSVNSLSDTISGVMKTIDGVWRGMWKGLSDFFGGIWKDIKGYAEDGINGVVKVINAGVDGIDSVWKFFTGHETSVKHLKPVKLATGGVIGGESQLAMVNDGAGSNWKELIELPNGEMTMSSKRNHLMPLPKGTRVYNGEETKSIMGMAGIKKYADGGIVGDAIDWGKGKLSDVGSWIGEKMEAITKFLKNPASAVKGIITKSTSGLMSGLGNFGELATGTFDKLAGSIASWFSKGLKKVQDEEQGDGGGGKGAPSGSGVTRWKSQVVDALKANGLSTSSDMVNKVLRQIATESGGNEKAVQGNIGDINNKTGDLAKGLMQVITSTFNANKFPGHNNPFNGYDSLLAGLNYAKKTYGSNLSFLGQGHGYANGGRTNGIGIVGEVEGEDEWVTNSNRPTADSTIIGSIKETAQKQPNSFAAKLAGVINGAKSGMQAITSQQPIIAGSSAMQSTNGGIDLSGDVHMTVQLDSGEIARVTYPKIKMLQNQEIQMKGQATGNTYAY
ncbi:tape measure protein [Leuconostoc mesenteroides]|nr:tape measure protein [Leuconostoc mesenteroides]